MSQHKIKKDRHCKSCDKDFHTDAKGLKQHWLVCMRFAKIGLTMAGGVTLK